MVCATCGREPGESERASAAVTWVRGLERGRVMWTCTECSRRYVRSIEGKLDSEWW